MARISPSLPAFRTDAGLARELDVLDRLQLSLPDGYEIFHSVAWHTLSPASDRHGEIDLVVLSPGGNMLLIEVKAGDVILRNGEIMTPTASTTSGGRRSCSTARCSFASPTRKSTRR